MISPKSPSSVSFNGGPNLINTTNMDVPVPSSDIHHLRNDLDMLGGMMMNGNQPQQTHETSEKVSGEFLKSIFETLSARSSPGTAGGTIVIVTPFTPRPSFTLFTSSRKISDHPFYPFLYLLPTSSHHHHHHHHHHLMIITLFQCVIVQELARGMMRKSWMIVTKMRRRMMIVRTRKKTMSMTMARTKMIRRNMTATVVVMTTTMTTWMTMMMMMITWFRENVWP